MFCKKIIYYNLSINKYLFIWKEDDQFQNPHHSLSLSRKKRTTKFCKKIYNYNLSIINRVKTSASAPDLIWNSSSASSTSLLSPAPLYVSDYLASYPSEMKGRRQIIWQQQQQQMLQKEKRWGKVRNYLGSLFFNFNCVDSQFELKENVRN